MTEKTIKKITDLGYNTHLNFCRSSMLNARESGSGIVEACEINNIMGYLRALRDVGILTDDEHKDALIYYTR